MALGWHSGEQHSSKERTGERVAQGYAGDYYGMERSGGNQDASRNTGESRDAAQVRDVRHSALQT